MSWNYTQRDGIFSRGIVSFTGYSGAASSKDHPEDESLAERGPIPVGSYIILAPQDTVTHGPFVLRLLPAPSNEMYGRSGFLIHGDSLEHPGAASEGCIVLNRSARETVWNSGDHDLTVVSGE